MHKEEVATNSIPTGNNGWRYTRDEVSLPESFSSIKISPNAGFWRTLLAFAGPGLMVAVGYMDPGNWATDIAGGAQFGYMLLSVILISNLWRFCSSIWHSS
jgi:manganese transport protein